jgi:hypothetical protein
MKYSPSELLNMSYDEIYELDIDPDYETDIELIEILAKHPNIYNCWYCSK